MQNEVLTLDSNIWISYVITRRLDKLVTLIRDNFKPSSLISLISSLSVYS
ncbi:MAG TPA: hypothetical protein PKM76_11675 [Bacteroidales bacterium]|nr:hypothetical protein [Bacteroidales bacterium]